MLDGVIGQSEFLGVVGELLKKRRVVGPVAREGRHFYREVRDVSELDLEFAYCVYSPRGVVFPPVETLLRFERDRQAFVVNPLFDDRPTALVGVHPCDLHALALLDRVFGEQGGRDEHYLARRRGLLVVGIDCPRPCTDGVFCGDMQTHAATSGFDVMLYKLSDAAGVRRFGVVYGSPQGSEWLRYSRRVLPATAADERLVAQYQRDKAANFPRAISTPLEELPALLDRSYDSLLWEATARRCYSCGSCNLSCPTCFCFDMRDELDAGLKSGRRVREWDACHLPGFSTVAGGHNFRPQAAARLRHRIYRKAKWIRERTGLPGCVGCARCDRACTAHINSVEIYNQLAEEV